MSTGSTKVSGKGSDGSQAAVASNGTSKKRTKRTFDYQMTERDKWALDIVRKSKNGLAAIAIAIQEGKPVNPTLLARISDCNSLMAEMLFQ